jgi:DNA-binding transcriptional LysR family regulator
VELYQLKTFATVADTGNVSKAAQILHTSQPAVSSQIKALENEFGFSLFERTSKGVLLTGQGRLVKERVEKLLDTVRDFDYFVQYLKKDPHLKLKMALNTDAGVLRIKELLSAAAEEHPEMEFQFTQSSTAVILTHIRQGTLDGGFFFGRQDDGSIGAVFLRRVELVIAAPSSWRMKIEAASLKQILELPWVMPPDNCPFHEKVSGLFRKHSLEPHRAASSDHETTTLQLVQSGIGVSLLPEYMCRAAVKRRELILWQREKYDIELSFAYLLKNKASPGIKTLRELLGKVWSP